MSVAHLLERCNNFRRLLNPWWESANFPIEQSEQIVESVERPKIESCYTDDTLVAPKPPTTLENSSANSLQSSNNQQSNKPHKCEVCGKGYTRRNILQKHINEKHNKRKQTRDSTSQPDNKRLCVQTDHSSVETDQPALA